MVEEIRVTSAGDTEVHRIAGEHIEVDDTLVIVVRDSAAEHLDPHLDLLGHIREHPLQALGIALGAGLAVGLLTKRGGDDLDDDDADADEADEEGLEEDESDDEDSTDSPPHRLRAFVAEHLSGMAADAVRQFVRRVARA
jgi:hypothetical protein